MDSNAVATVRSCTSHAWVGPTHLDPPQLTLSLTDLPTDLLHQVLQDAHPRLRATSRAFRALVDGSCTAWRLVHRVGRRQHMVDLTTVLQRLPLLTSLTVDPGAAQALHFLSACPGLTAISFTACHITDTDLHPLTHCSRLASLTLASCFHIGSFAPLAALTSLQLLKIHECGSLPDLGCITWVTALSLLTSVSLDRSRLGPAGLADLTALRTLASLSLPHLRPGTSPVDLSPLTHVTSLTLLDLSWCRQVVAFEWLAGLPSLTSLSLAHCWYLTGVTWLSALTALTHLDLTGCFHVVPPLPLGACANLRTLLLTRCALVSEEDRAKVQAACGPQLRIKHI